MLWYSGSGIDAGIKFRPTLEELKAIGPDFTTRWENYFANAPDKPVLWMGPISACVSPSTQRCIWVYMLSDWG